MGRTRPWAIVGLGLLASICLIWPLFGIRDPKPTMGVVDPVSTTGSVADGFVVGGSYKTTRTDLLPATVPLFGSWNPDASPASMVSPWYRSEQGLRVGLAGYLRGTTTVVLRIQPDGGSERIVTLPDRSPGEAVALVELDTGSRGRFRIEARTDGTDWIGLTPPVRIDEASRVLALDVLLAVSTFVLCFVLVFLPGLLFRRARAEREGRRRGGSTVPAVGVVACAALGVVMWGVTPGSAGRVVAGVVAALALATVIGLWARRPTGLVDRNEAVVMALMLCLGVTVVGRTLWSASPDGELFANTVSRAGELGDRSDNRIPYHQVQLVAHGAGPESPMARALLEPWSYSTRGPVAGLAAAPIVAATGGTPPVGFPNEPWYPVDRQGYEAFRLMSAVLGLTVVWAAAAAARRLAGDRAALITAALLAVSPFVLHELLFTWPKLLTAALVMMSLELLVDRRPGWAGLAMGGAFLAHPSALLYVVPLGLAIIARRHARADRPWLVQGLWFGSTLVATWVAWRLVNWGSNGQDVFFDYLKEADGAGDPGVATWIGSRLSLAANTLVPGAQWIGRRNTPNLNALGGRQVSGWSQWFVQYWTVAPFAAGLALAPMWVGGIVRWFRRRWELAAALVVAPLVVFFGFWGFSSSGGMREALHPWLAAVAVCAGAGWARSRVPGPRWIGLMTGVAALEGLLMLVLPTVATGPLVRAPFELSDVAALALMLIGTVLVATVAGTAISVTGPTTTLTPHDAVDTPREADDDLVEAAST